MFETILIPIDPDAPLTWEKALPAAVKLAQTHDAKLLVMTVVPAFSSNIVASYFPKGFEQEALQKAEAELLTVVKQHVPGELNQALLVGHGRIWQEICRLADDHSADLIVMASHKPEFSDLLLAPTADQVLHHSPRSVMIVR